jgi:hypothetical protein
VAVDRDAFLNVYVLIRKIRRVGAHEGGCRPKRSRRLFRKCPCKGFCRARRRNQEPRRRSDRTALPREYATRTPTMAELRHNAMCAKS